MSSFSDTDADSDSSSDDEIPPNSMQASIAGQQNRGDGQGNFVARDMQNLSGNSNMVFNVTYNVHYQSDRPSEEHMRDVEAYGDDYSRSMNRRSLEICEKVMSSSCIDYHHERFCITDPILTDEDDYYGGSTGIPTSAKYIPDAKYRKTYKRKRDGKRINLIDLHKKPESDRDVDPVMHVMIVGNQGCGKSVLCKRYGQMVLNREVPELADIEVVHYVNMKDIGFNTTDSIPGLIFERFIHLDRSHYKYGWEWIKKNPSKFLFIFDQADRFVDRFSEDCYPVNYFTKTTPHDLLQNIIQNRIFRGCHTLIAVREWPLRGLYGRCRPDKLVMVGPLTVDQRLLLTRSICPESFTGEKYCDDFIRKFPMGFTLTADPLLLYFAISSFKWGEDSRNAKTSTDVMLVLTIFQHLLRTSSSSRKFPQTVVKFRHVAFDMIKDEKRRISSKDLEKYGDIAYEEMEDVMVVAPEHNSMLTYRLLSSDYCYFFAYQVYMEAYAACHISDMTIDHFKKFLDSDIHSPRWLVVRRFVCGINANKDTKPLAEYYVSRRKSPKDYEKAVLSSMEKEIKKIESMSTETKMELLASLHECGESAASIISHLKELVLRDYMLEPADLYIIMRVSQYVQAFRNIDITLHADVNITEYEDVISMALRKGEKICIDISHMELSSGHANGIERLLKVASPKNGKRHLKVIIGTSASPPVAKLFKGLENARSGSTVVILQEGFAPLSRKSSRSSVSN